MAYFRMLKMLSAACIFLLISFNSASTAEMGKTASLPLEGTWQLLSGTTIQGKDTTVVDYTKDKKFIKIINGTHFAFTGHDLTKGRDSSAFFSSGAGTYSLSDSNYTEHLQYCSDRAWEGNDFSFIISIQQDTLVQKGIEKIEKLGVDRLNIERYLRVKN
jgi:hypothetical protein